MADTDEAAAQEDAEWASALEDFAPGYDKEEVVDDKTTTETTTAETTTETTTEVETTTETTTVDPNETPEQKTEREEAAKIAAEESDSKDKNDAKQEPQSDTRTTKQTVRDAAREVETVAKDVREKMFADTPQQLQDADGDPIKGIEDVMKLLNPRTGEAFTEEEASMWLLSAQQQFNQNLANTDKQINQIAEVNVDLKDEADNINYQYGALLKEMPDLRDQLWAEYSKTLVQDPNSGIITNKPVSLERFYEIALQPYIKLAESLEATEKAKTDAEKAEADAKRTRTRVDRSDIFGRGKVDDMDAEEKEWATAAADYYGNK